MRVEKDIQRSHSPRPYTKQVQLQQVAQNRGWSGSEYLQRYHWEPGSWVQSLTEWKTFSLYQVRISCVSIFVHCILSTLCVVHCVHQKILPLFLFACLVYLVLVWFNTLLLEVVNSSKIPTVAFTFQGWTNPVLSASQYNMGRSPLTLWWPSAILTPGCQCLFCTVEPRMDIVLHMQSSGTKEKGIIAPLHLLEEE